MHLKRNVDLVSFLKAIEKCGEDVRFCTMEEDVLNLTSTLSKYILVSLKNKEDILYSARIICSNSEDEELLKDFLTV